MVAYVVASGDFYRPTSLQIIGVTITDLLAGFPCPADLRSWRETTFHTLDRDWVKPFEIKRNLAEIKIAEVADGYSVTGEAISTIRELIQTSIDTVNQAMGWTQSHMVVDMSPITNPAEDVVIRVTDDDIWSTVSDYMRFAGLNVAVEMRFPEDEPVNGVHYDYPIAVVKVTNHDG